MDTKWLFLDPHGRLRSGWRFAVFSVLFTLVLLLFSGVTVGSMIALNILPGENTAAMMVVNGLVIFIPALLVGWLCGKYLESLPFSALGTSFTKGWLTHLIAGVLVGAATLSLAILIAYMLGGLGFEMNPVDGGSLLRGLLVSFAVLTVGAAAEEVLFRGYIFQTFVRSHLAPLAILLTALFFGVIHARNPDAGWISTLNTILAGVWFGVAYLKTRDLWFVFGAHLLWNWMQGAIFGIEISGLTNLASTPLLKEIDVGPAWLTGSNYGLEGGIAATIALVVSIVGIYFVPLKAGDLRSENSATQVGTSNGSGNRSASN